jgi:hypothetical protein
MAYPEEAISVPAYKRRLITRWQYTIGRTDSATDDIMGHYIQSAEECFAI